MRTGHFQQWERLLVLLHWQKRNSIAVSARILRRPYAAVANMRRRMGLYAGTGQGAPGRKQDPNHVARRIAAGKATRAAAAP